MNYAIAILFGGAIFLAISEKFGPMATMGIAGAMLLGVILVDMLRAAEAERQARIDRAALYRRWDSWR